MLGVGGGGGGGGAGEVDVLSIDIDGKDFYIWAKLDPGLRAKVVVIEYNSFIDVPALKVQGPEMGGDGGTVFFGAGLGALAHLGVRLGYTLGRNSEKKKKKKEFEQSLYNDFTVLMY